MQGHLDMANFLAYLLAMQSVNIGELKNNLSKYLSRVEQGETVAVCKRNLPFALLVPYARKQPENRTRLGCGQGTVHVLGDLTEPLIPSETWEMHGP